MIQSLKKGLIFVEIWHEFGSELIGAKGIELELEEDFAIFRIKFSPVDGNQKSDIDSLLSDEFKTIRKIVVRDDQIRQRTERNIRAYNRKLSHIKLELNYRQVFLFTCRLDPVDKDCLEFNLGR